MHFEQVVQVPTVGDKSKRWVFGTCKSDEEKPMDVAFGSRLMEIDTSTMYHFDDETQQWLPWGGE